MDKKPLYTRSIDAGTRVYYMDAHIDKYGEKYLAISEIPTAHNRGKKKRNRIFVYGRNLIAFAKALADITNLINNDSERWPDCFTRLELPVLW